MKKEFTRLVMLASAGAIFQTGPMAFAAGDAQFKAATQPDASVELQSNINEPSGANAQLNQAQLKRASQLIGTEVRNQQDEKIGAVKDLMVDLQSGQAPFAVVSSGGFFGVGDRLLAVPTMTFAPMGDRSELVLNMDRERLQSAPSFDKNQWPDMTDQEWSSRVYSFYGQQPKFQSSTVASTGSTTINEPAGAQLSTRGNAAKIYPETYGETETGLSPDRRPRQGLGAEDLTRNEQRIRNPGGHADSDVLIQEQAGAESTRTDTTGAGVVGRDRIKRASELIGMEVKNAQNERIGEIKDLVVDLKSGRVSYAVLEAGGLAELDKLYAVPPSVFTRSVDGQWLVFNTDKETLRTSPSFEKNNWPQATNQKFTSEVYRFYHQPPYWQSSGEIREPSGSRQEMKLHRDSRDSSSEWQRGNQYLSPQREIQEPSGAPPSTQIPGGQLEEPAQSEPERHPSNPSAEHQSQGSAAKETAEIQSATPQAQQPAPDTQVQEPAGATTESTAPATSEDQAQSDSDRQLSKQVRTALQTDAALSTEAPDVKVSAANGRITLRGTVSTEQQKQSIAAKAQQIAGGADKVDNQLEVKSNATNP